MALLTDGNPNDTPALQVYEMGILEVAHVEGIDLSLKLNLATIEISASIMAILLDNTSTTDPLMTTRRTIGVSDVVVSPQITRWHALQTLAIVYRDAFNNQLNDRYLPKWNEYKMLALSAQDQTMLFGIGLATTPIPQAPTPVFSVVPGTGPDTIYYVQVTWVSASGQEGQPSDLTTDETAAGSTLVVGTVNPPAVAAGYNVYLGLLPDLLTLQNATPVPLGVNFTVPSSGLVAGNAPGNGQPADTYVIGARSLRRG